MSVVSVQPKDFILALFIRDDGERFLLGDNGYDFMDSQLHFAANTIENDEVEKQGADGTMLAGQVRRASVQTFDGYVGDATTPKEEIEQMRRAFIAFFLKGHHYRVIYVDCARNAWQRKGGYLVDAPEVKELFQVHPEYHVGLNFEDVNYYSYDENAEGDEITANLVQVAISSAVEGGLVWDEDGAVSEDATVVYDGDTATASGTSITVSDAVEAPLSDFKLKGNTKQDGTPTPDAPVPVQTVTGENVVKISDGQGNEQSYYVDLFGSKNIFDKGNAKLFEGYLGTNNVVANASATSLYIPVTEGRTYTFSRPNTTSQASDANLAFIASEPANGVGYIGGRQAVGTDLAATATAPTGAKYMVIYFAWGQNDSTIATILSGYQIEIGASASAYEAYSALELCKIGTYQDYIHKSGGKWYLHKATHKLELDGSDDEGWSTTGTNVFATAVGGGIDVASTPIGLCSHAVFNPVQTNVTGTLANGEFAIQRNDDNGNGRIFFTNTGIATTNNFKAWVAANLPQIVYNAHTQTDTQITNQALIAQLEAILSQGKTYAGTNNITTVISAGNEQGELEVGYYTRYDFTITAGGYVWEQGGSGGPTTVMNESIDNVYPIWTITGPITNPVLENTTTGEQIEYVGTIGDGQTLVIDMGAQTALLDGLNVVANIVGEFLSLVPGSNTLIYSVDSGDKASEIGWSEIVG